MRKFIIILLITNTFIAYSPAQSKSLKRGIAYQITGISDLQALSSGISWYYNWAQNPSSNLIPYLISENVQYVPMIWNGTQGSIDQANSYYQTDPNNGYLLGFNEPNFPDQANMTPAVAAAFWPKLEELATTYNLKLVAPAVNYSAGIYDPKYGKIMYQDPYSYLDTFFMECPACQVDYISVHWYGHGGLETIVNNMWDRFHKPIWVTEFASWDASVNPMTLELEKDFMVKYVDWLENNPHVFRYAWFTARSSSNDFIDLLGTAGKLTELGNLYVNMPVHDTSYYRTIPARVEAENYSLMVGIQLQTTNDVDGLLNVGWIDANDYVEYNIDAPESKSYPFRIRYSSVKNTQISVKEELTEIKLIDLGNTSSYSNWQTLETNLNLTAGQHKLRFFAVNNGFNLNWIQFGDIASGLNEIGIENPDFKIISNPVKNGQLKIAILKENIKENPVRLEIIDLSGKLLISKNIEGNNFKEFNLNLNENGKINAGFYVLRLYSKTGILIEKFVIE